MNLLYTNNIDSTVYDQYLDPTIMGNVINDNLSFLQKEENCIVADVDDQFKFRPELISAQYYGSEQYYPLILAANNIGSLLQFIPAKFNNRIKIIKIEVVQKLLGI